ncbi:MAG TPA: hypothetical protein VEH28_04145 [Thermoplasmata archaeon]|nr:hypothetical protein [Thermoplasmata archaeon]
MADNKKRRRLGAIVVLIGAILLIVAAFIPWYAWSQKATIEGASITGTYNFYPGLPSSNGTIQTTYSCSGLPSGFPCPSGTSTSYNNLPANNTGQIAESGFFILIVGFILGFIGAIMGLMSGGNPRRAAPAIALALIAMILGIVAVGMFAGLLPGAVAKDTPGHTGSGPWSTFFGSGNTTYHGIPASSNWGPAIGWYLTIGAFVVLLIGLLILLMARKDMAEPMPAAAPAPTTGAPPATPPPSS